MKNEQVLKSFTALSFDGNTVVAADLPAARASSAELVLDGVPGDMMTMSDDFREMLNRRYNAPYVVASDYRHWGINE